MSNIEDDRIDRGSDSFPKTLSPQLTRRSVATSRTNSERFARGTSQICQSTFKILKETNRKMENESQYDDDIIVVLELPDAIRCRANMYLGNLEREDLFDDLIFEALCHAIDESLDDRCKHINIDIDRAGIVTVRYDAGIPLHIANGLLGKLYACHNLKKHIEVGSKYCQLGLAVLNAVCSEFQVDIVCNGKHGRQTYIKGKAEQDFVVFDSHEIDRTQFKFSFDEELLGKHEIHLDRLKVKAEELMQNFNLRVEISVNSVHSTH